MDLFFINWRYCFQNCFKNINLQKLFITNSNYLQNKLFAHKCHIKLDKIIIKGIVLYCW